MNAHSFVKAQTTKCKHKHEELRKIIRKKPREIQSLYFVYHHGFLQVCQLESKTTSGLKGFINLGCEVPLSLKAGENTKSE